MAFDRGRLLSSGVLGTLAGCLLPGLALADTAGPRFPLFSYPSAEVSTVPRNAQFFASVADREDTLSMMLDDDYSGLESVGETGVHRHRFASIEPLSPGPHRVSMAGPGTPLFEVAIEVEDVFGPEPDAVASVRVTRAVHVVAGPSAAAYEGARLERAALLADPADCSTAVLDQLDDRDYGVIHEPVDYRLELEAEGPILAFIVDGSIFLPGGCRGAYLPSLGATSPGGFETGPVLVQVVTATGAGTSQERDVEDYTPPDADLPASAVPPYQEARACGIGSAGSQPSRGIGMSLVLLSGAAIARRRARWLRAARP